MSWEKERDEAADSVVKERCGNVYAAMRLANLDDPETRHLFSAQLELGHGFIRGADWERNRTKEFIDKIREAFKEYEECEGKISEHNNLMSFKLQVWDAIRNYTRDAGKGEK